MIDRIVLFKLKDEYCNDAARAAFAERTRRDLSALERVRSVTVGVPADEASEASWDISIVVRFDSMEDVQQYIVDPAHRAYVDGYAMPRIEVRKAWNFHS
ncbi:MAG: Dabb family protein [Myxococcales bacterium]|nr:Dabb family protein [Myxococcales bacterium]